MKTRHFIKTIIKQRVKTFFLNTLIALNVKWVPQLNVIVTSQALITCLILRSLWQKLSQDFKIGITNPYWLGISPISRYYTIRNFRTFVGTFPKKTKKSFLRRKYSVKSSWFPVSKDNLPYNRIRKWTNNIPLKLILKSSHIASKIT